MRLMARASRRSARSALPWRRQAVTLDLTPMVDVVFLLIIFFLVSTTFITFEDALPVQLPQAESTLAQANDLVTITINQDEIIFLGTAETALEDVTSDLRSLGRDLQTVVLRADESASHGFTVQVMDAIKQAGAQNIAIATGGR